MKQPPPANPKFTGKLPRTGGRKKGEANKLTKDIKAEIIASFEMLGGRSWLLKQGYLNPQAYMQLLGKVLPIQQQIGGLNGEPLAAPSINVIFTSENDDEKQDGN